MQQIDKIVKYTGTKAVSEKHNRQTCKHNKFNKEFTQYSWATSPCPAFNGSLYIMFSKQSFYNSELNLSLTQQI